MTRQEAWVEFARECIKSGQTSEMIAAFVDKLVSEFDKRFADEDVLHVWLDSAVKDLKEAPPGKFAIVANKDNLEFIELSVPIPKGQNFFSALAAEDIKKGDPCVFDFEAGAIIKDKPSVGDTRVNPTTGEREVFLGPFTKGKPEPKPKSTLRGFTALEDIKSGEEAGLRRIGEVVFAKKEWAKAGREAGGVE